MKTLKFLACAFCLVGLTGGLILLTVRHESTQAIENLMKKATPDEEQTTESVDELIKRAGALDESADSIYMGVLGSLPDMRAKADRESREARLIFERVIGMAEGMNVSADAEKAFEKVIALTKQAPVKYKAMVSYSRFLIRFDRIDEAERLMSPLKLDPCPSCKSILLAIPILYGLGNEGGCCISYDSPSSRCTKCNLCYGTKEEDLKNLERYLGIRKD